MTHPSNSDLRAWMLGLLDDRPSLTVERSLVTSGAGQDPLHGVETELIGAHLDGTLSPQERRAFVDLLASCDRLTHQLAEEIRSRLLQQQPIEVNPSQSDPELEFLISAERVRLCRQYRDRRLAPDDEAAFEALALRSPLIDALFDLALRMLQHQLDEGPAPSIPLDPSTPPDPAA